MNAQTGTATVENINVGGPLKDDSFMETYKTATAKLKQTCPHCGYCPHCGRGNYPYQYQPYQWFPGNVTYSITPQVTYASLN